MSLLKTTIIRARVSFLFPNPLLQLFVIRSDTLSPRTGRLAPRKRLWSEKRTKFCCQSWERSVSISLSWKLSIRGPPATPYGASNLLWRVHGLQTAGSTILNYHFGQCAFPETVTERISWNENVEIKGMERLIHITITG